ncbi:ABC transporter ATP-binding protein [Sinorhizobium meliloti]|nr:ABC transporter ATP-binding protein [Sinorhizobium meliloti]MDW9984194.1 ATP-binding cassette domain-containing protein [Sinorhizobium meliloti]MDX0269971.1 ATP-binding cassette domain-containing protein [Sinorhizobium meliloti]MQX74495.1 ATP-binding cassette domain-containing protein [Sinorhizobium meliloti]RVI63256.1 ABC transporter ATP-binding protein [Sinorhizobium meliloti]
MIRPALRIPESAVGPVLAVKNLSVTLSRNGRPARVLDNMTFELFPGEIVALVGESGSGKSSMGLALQGFLPRESEPHMTGSIRLNGIELVGAGKRVLRAARRDLVRAIPQDPMDALNPTMTIGRQMRESTRADEASILRWLRQTGLTDAERIADALPHRLSGGQRQRVLIAMGMMAKPKVLIADEPTTALDVTIQGQILDLLRQLSREQRTAILCITHDLGVAASLADRVLVLYAGRIGEIGRTQDVVRNPGHPYTAGLLAARYDFNSDRSRPLPTLPGERRGSINAVSSCLYATRCPIAQAGCSERRPLLLPTAAHAGVVACFHAEQTPHLATQSLDTKPWPTETTRESVALELSNVRKSYATGVRRLWARSRPQPVLKSINLSIRLGECVSLVGESGAGKSTILRIAAGLLAPDSGDVFHVDEIPPQMVFQDPVSALTPWLTIGEQIGDRLRPLGTGIESRRIRVAEALELVGLDPALMHALPGELSVGQCQRAGVARAVVVPPKLLLCDEPVSAMDVSLAATILNLLGDLRRRLGMAMLIVTHDLAAARIIADRIVVLKDGELVEVADADTLMAANRTAYTRSLVAAVPSLHAGACE